MWCRIRIIPHLVDFFLVLSCSGLQGRRRSSSWILKVLSLQKDGRTRNSQVLCFINFPFHHGLGGWIFHSNTLTKTKFWGTAPRGHSETPSPDSSANHRSLTLSFGIAPHDQAQKLRLKFIRVSHLIVQLALSTDTKADSSYFSVDRLPPGEGVIILSLLPAQLPISPGPSSVPQQRPDWPMSHSSATPSVPSPLPVAEMCVRCVIFMFYRLHRSVYDKYTHK